MASVTIQQSGSATTVITAAPASTTATVTASTVPSVPTAVTSIVVTAPPIGTSTGESSGSSTLVAVTGSSVPGTNPPGSTYVPSTQSVATPIVIVYSQDALKRYDGSSSPKEFMDHFNIIADVNGWKTKLDKLKHLKAALDGRAALQIKGLDESDSVKTFAALRGRLLSHFDSPNEVSNARRQFYCRSQLKGEAIDEYADVLLKLNRTGWSAQTLKQQDTDLQNRFVEGLRLPKLQKYLRLQYADLGFGDTIKKVQYYVEVKVTSKRKKTSVRFASNERDSAANVIILSTVGLEPVINCLKNREGRIEKLERGKPPARSSTPLNRSASPAVPQSQNDQQGRASTRPSDENRG